MEEPLLGQGERLQLVSRAGRHPGRRQHRLAHWRVRQVSLHLWFHHELTLLWLKDVKYHQSVFLAILWLKIPPELLTTESPTPAVPLAAQKALWLTFSQCGSHRSQTSCPLQPFVGFLPPLWSGEVAVRRVLSSQRRSPWALFWSPFGDIPGAPRASAGGGRGRDVSGFHTSLTTRSIGSKRSCRPETWHWLVSSLLLSKNIRAQSYYKEIFHVKANLIRCLMYLQLCQIWDLQNAITRENCNFRLNSWVGLFF